MNPWAGARHRAQFGRRRFCPKPQEFGKDLGWQRGLALFIT
jgi:hypothetical protein